MNNKTIVLLNLAEYRLILANSADQAIFRAISQDNCLKDPQLAPDPDARKALGEIKNIKNVSDLHSLEAQILADFKEVLNREISNLTQQSERTQEEVEGTKKEVEQLKQLVQLMTKRLEVLEQTNGLISHFYVVLQSLNSWHRNLIISLKGISKGILALWVMVFLFCSFCVILDDDTFIRDGKLK